MFTEKGISNIIEEYCIYPRRFEHELLEKTKDILKYTNRDIYYRNKVFVKERGKIIENDENSELAKEMINKIEEIIK